MPRMRRNYNQVTNLYHVIIRGVDKQDVFYEDKDRYKFLKELANTKEKYKFQLCAYCLMDNHVHLVIHDRNQNLSKSIQSLMIRYTSYFNQKEDRIGYLVQGRFLSKNIMNQKYFVNVCRYIHQNPLKANISKMEEFKWSSYQEYLGNLVYKEKLVDAVLLLNKFSKTDYNEAIKEFVKFHKEFEEFSDGTDIVEYEMNKVLTDEQLRNIIQEMWNLDNINEIKQYSAKKKREMLRKILTIKGTNCNQIARVIGITRKVVTSAREKRDKWGRFLNVPLGHLRTVPKCPKERRR